MNLVLLILIGLRLVFWFIAFPNSDEAYYWWWAKNFSLSYYDHPPLMAWLQGAIAHIWGNSLFGLRLLNLVSNFILFLIYWRILQYLYQEQSTSLLSQLVTLVLCSPLYFVMLSLAWHDHLLITLCLASSYYLLQYLDGYLYLHTVREWQLYLAVALLALALIAKYNALLMGLGFLITILSDRALRKIITWQRIMISSTIILVVFSPVLVWNITHNFPSFSYYAVRTIDSGSIHQRLLEPLGFISISLVMLSPFLSWLMWRSFTAGDLLKNEQTIYSRMAWNCFFSATIFLFCTSLISTAYYYWNITAYLLLFPVIVSHKLDKLKPWLSGYGVVFAFLFVFNSSVLPVSALWSGDGDQDGRMLFGWDKVQAEIIRFTHTHQPAIITTDYRLGSAIAFQFNTDEVTVLSPRVSQFNFVESSRPPEVALWDDWHPIDYLQAKVAVDLNQRLTIPIDRFGIFIKNYYIAPVLRD